MIIALCSKYEEKQDENSDYFYMLTSNGIVHHYPGWKMARTHGNDNSQGTAR
ncbi:hypothetical protein WN48_00268 [Eufriesea mexicana]|nr:hypothetical protein WN48_00268 [Eufriesea mexicana]